MDLTLKEQIDYYIEFKDLYLKIIKEFNFDYKKDLEARDLLSQIFKKKRNNWNFLEVLYSFKTIIQSKKKILVYGCGPTLDVTVEILLKKRGINFFNNFINLVADGAAIYLRENNIPIDGIFSDLDGITHEEFNHSKFIIIHSHGDNIKKLKHFEESILNFNNIIGTTQVEPLENLINPGGFTDGDRILYLLRALLLPEQKLFLIGMDFNNIIGKYSKPEMTDDQVGSPIKIKKLKYAVKLIEFLSERMSNGIYFINSNIISILFNYLSIEEFIEKF